MTRFIMSLEEQKGSDPLTKFDCCIYLVCTSRSCEVYIGILLQTTSGTEKIGLLNELIYKSGK